MVIFSAISAASLARLRQLASLSIRLQLLALEQHNHAIIFFPAAAHHLIGGEVMDRRTLSAKADAGFLETSAALYSAASECRRFLSAR